MDKLFEEEIQQNYNHDKLELHHVTESIQKPKINAVSQKYTKCDIHFFYFIKLNWCLRN